MAAPKGTYSVVTSFPAKTKRGEIVHVSVNTAHAIADWFEQERLDQWVEQGLIVFTSDTEEVSPRTARRRAAAEVAEGAKSGKSGRSRSSRSGGKKGSRAQDTAGYVKPANSTASE